jgi:hypothetical protein
MEATVNRTRRLGRPVKTERRLSMNREFVDAVKKLIEAVTFEQHIDVSGESHFAQQVTIECLDAVLKSIRAAPELSSLHEWVDRQLAGDYDDPGSYQAARYLSDKDIQDAREFMEMGK